MYSLVGVGENLERLIIFLSHSYMIPPPPISSPPPHHSLLMLMFHSDKDAGKKTDMRMSDTHDPVCSVCESTLINNSSCFPLQKLKESLLIIYFRNKERKRK